MKATKQRRKKRAAIRVQGLLEAAERGEISQGQRESIEAGMWEPTEIEILRRAISNLKGQLLELTE